MKMKIMINLLKTHLEGVEEWMNEIEDYVIENGCTSLEYSEIKRLLEDHAELEYWTDLVIEPHITVQ